MSPSDASSELRPQLDLSLEALDLAPAENARRRLLALVDLVAAWAPRINLSGHREPREILDHLVVEALALERQLPAARRIVDLGSGAGFPGLPIAIVRAHAEVLLVDSREKRHHFQRTAVRALALCNVAPLRGRSEDLTPRPADLVVAQAMADPRRALDWMLPWASPDAWIALPMSSQPVEINHDSIEEQRLQGYAIPPSGRRRNVWLGRVRC